MARVMDTGIPIDYRVVEEEHADWSFGLRYLRSVRTNLDIVVPEVVPDVIDLTRVANLQAFTIEVVVNPVIVNVVGPIIVAFRRQRFYAIGMDRAIWRFSVLGDFVPAKFAGLHGFIGVGHATENAVRDIDKTHRAAGLIR